MRKGTFFLVPLSQSLTVACAVCPRPPSRVTDKCSWRWAVLCATGLGQSLAEKWVFRKYLCNEAVRPLNGSSGLTHARHMSDLC